MVQCIDCKNKFFKNKRVHYENAILTIFAKFLAVSFVSASRIFLSCDLELAGYDQISRTIFLNPLFQFFSRQQVRFISLLSHFYTHFETCFIFSCKSCILGKSCKTVVRVTVQENSHIPVRYTYRRQFPGYKVGTYVVWVLAIALLTLSVWQVWADREVIGTPF